MPVDDLPGAQGRAKEMSAMTKIVMLFFAAMLVNVTWGLWKGWAWPDYTASATITGVYAVLTFCICRYRKRGIS